jgi:hypothetical protein
LSLSQDKKGLLKKRIMLSTFDKLKQSASLPTSKESISRLREINIENIFDEVFANEFALANISVNSTLHPNGFYKIVLWEGNTGERLRIHFWSDTSKGITPHESDIHDHFWEFSSLVLFGAVYSELFIPTSDSIGSDYLHFLLHDQSNQSYILEKIENSRLSCTEYRTFKKGSIYSLNESQLHRVQCENNTATLVLQGSRKNKNNHVYTNYSKNTGSQIYLQKLTTSDIVDLLNTIKSHL